MADIQRGKFSRLNLCMFLFLGEIIPGRARCPFPAFLFPFYLVEFAWWIFHKFHLNVKLADISFCFSSVSLDFFWAAKSAVETAFFQLLPFLWLMHCACKFDAALWAEAEAVGKTHFSLHCSLLLENSNGDAGGGMQSSRNWLCFCGRWQWHCGCGNFGGADDGKMRRGEMWEARGKCGRVANDEWKMCGKLLRQNSAALRAAEERAGCGAKAAKEIVKS